MSITFGTFKHGGTAKRLAGVCVGSPQFVSYTNGAVDQLLRRGNWYTSFRTVRGCVYNGCVTWPRQVQTILSIRNSGQYQRVFNKWFNFLPMNDRDHGYFYRDWHLGGMRERGRTVTDGTSPVFNPIAPGHDLPIRFYIDSPTDLGKTITLIGIDCNGQFIRTQRKDGTVQDGIQLTFALPYVQTPYAMRHIQRVVKDETNYNVRGYQVLPDGTMLELALYEPSETSPEYITTQTSRTHNRVWNGCCEGEVEALVKIKFVPVKYDNDLLLIDNETALANMVMAVRFKEMGDLTNARGYEVEAMRELNYQMRNVFPDEQFVVDFRPFGRDDLNRDNIRIGMI